MTPAQHLRAACRALRPHWRPGVPAVICAKGIEIATLALMHVAVAAELRGLAETTRLAMAKGGRRETLMGLSGLGDLILTASSSQSRNYSLGFALGQGQSLEAILASRHSVTEGVHTAGAVVGMAETLGIEMPISSAVDAVINRGVDLDEAINALLSRPFRSELG